MSSGSPWNASFKFLMRGLSVTGGHRTYCDFSTSMIHLPLHFIQHIRPSTRPRISERTKSVHRPARATSVIQPECHPFRSRQQPLIISSLSLERSATRFTSSYFNHHLNHQKHPRTRVHALQGLARSRSGRKACSTLPMSILDTHAKVCKHVTIKRIPNYVRS